MAAEASQRSEEQAATIRARQKYSDVLCQLTALRWPCCGMQSGGCCSKGNWLLLEQLCGGAPSKLGLELGRTTRRLAGGPSRFRK